MCCVSVHSSAGLCTSIYNAFVDLTWLIHGAMHCMWHALNGSPLAFNGNIEIETTCALKVGHCLPSFLLASSFVLPSLFLSPSLSLSLFVWRYRLFLLCHFFSLAPARARPLSLVLCGVWHLLVRTQWRAHHGPGVTVLLPLDAGMGGAHLRVQRTPVVPQYIMIIYQYYALILCFPPHFTL